MAAQGEIQPQCGQQDSYRQLQYKHSLSAPIYTKGARNTPSAYGVAAKLMISQSVTPNAHTSLSVVKTWLANNSGDIHRMRLRALSFPFTKTCNVDIRVMHCINMKQSQQTESRWIGRYAKRRHLDRQITRQKHIAPDVNQSVSQRAAMI